jgi:hypothetical protein
MDVPRCDLCGRRACVCRTCDGMRSIDVLVRLRLSGGDACALMLFSYTRALCCRHKPTDKRVRRIFWDASAMISARCSVILCCACKRPLASGVLGAACGLRWGRAVMKLLDMLQRVFEGQQLRSRVPGLMRTGRTLNRT